MQPLRSEIDREIKAVLDSCAFIGGNKLQQFEAQIADYLEVENAIGVSSGTDALLVALMAIDVGPGDLVITTPYSFFATAGVIHRLGAVPVFVDIELTDFNLSVSELERWIEEHPAEVSRVKAIIPVHLFGQAADLSPICDVARKHGFYVVEDAAQAIGTIYKDSSGIERKAGTVGDVGCFSFFPSKNLGGIGDGGLVVTQNEELGVKLQKLRNHGSSPKYYHQLVGGNFRLDSIQAAVLSVKLPHLNDWHRERQKNAAHYNEILRQVDELVLPYVNQDPSYHIFNQYVIRAKDRDGLKKHLSDRGVSTEIYYPLPFHLQECFAHLDYAEGSFPASESAAKESLAIPVYPGLTAEQQLYVASQVVAFYE